MAATPKVLALAGSLRTDSYNKKLVKVAARGAESAGAQVTLIDLREFELPIYDGDIETASGLPAGAKRLKKMFIESDGVLIASPEYNSSISGALKNAIDWISRPEPGEAPFVAFSGKVAGLLAASPGAYGGLRGLVEVRRILGNIMMHVLPDQMVVAKAHEAFAEDGSLKDAKSQAWAEKIGREVAEVAHKLKA